MFSTPIKTLLFGFERTFKETCHKMESQFQSSDDGYEAKVRENFNRQEIMKTVNASIIAIQPVEASGTE